MQVAGVLAPHGRVLRRPPDQPIRRALTDNGSCYRSDAWVPLQRVQPDARVTGCVLLAVPLVLVLFGGDVAPRSPS